MQVLHWDHFNINKGKEYEQKWPMQPIRFHNVFKAETEEES